MRYARQIATTFALVAFGAGSAIAQDAPEQSAADAQTTVSGYYYGSLGLASPRMSGMENSWGSGLALSGGVEYPFSKHLAARGDLTIGFFGLDSDGFGGDIGYTAEYSGGSLAAISGALYAKLMYPLASVTPYALVGGGQTSFFLSDIEVNGRAVEGFELEDQLGYSTGVGVDYQLSPSFKAFAEAVVTRTFGGDGYAPIRAGVMLTQ